MVEHGKIGVTDLAVFYPADYDLALAVVHLLNGDFDEAQRVVNGWRDGADGRMPDGMTTKLGE